MLAAAAVFAASVDAAWSPAAEGSAFARSKTLGPGKEPVGAATLGSVAVTWVASTYAEGGTVDGYVVRRYDAVTGDEASIGAACSGIVAGTSCTESGVPAGSWRYTVTPAVGNWRGGESPRSDAVVVLL